jgi:hypothetical protein
MSVRLRLLAVVLTVAMGTVPARARADDGRQQPGSATPPAAEPQPPPAQTEPAAPVVSTPNDLSRIRQALSQPPAITLDAQQLRYYLEIIARQQTFANYVKGYDFINGPTKRGDPMTHQEFLNMVTPKEMYSSAGITATDMLQVAVTNWLGKALISKALEDLQHAKSDREAQEIRDRITRELDALDAARRK